MRDPVGEELERRWAEPWPWRSALIAALLLHITVAVAVTVAPARRHRSLRLPSVQVRMVSPLAVPAGRAAAPAGVPARAAAPAPAPQKRAPARPAARPSAPPARAAVSTGKAPAVAPPPAASEPVAARTGEETPPAGAPDGEPGALRSPTGAIGLGAGGGAAEEPFPFTYYLTRFVGVVESNWFRPPVPSETRCRVRCRIDRTGRLLEAGIEEESGVPAFDRAALRAIYAATPFPPLPQGFGGAALTLHLDFGPQ